MGHTKLHVAAFGARLRDFLPDALQSQNLLDWRNSTSTRGQHVTEYESEPSR